MDFPSDAGPYSTTQDVVHQVVNWVGDPSPLTASVGAPSSATQKDVHVQGGRTYAVALNPAETDGWSIYKVSGSEYQQVKFCTIHTKSEREKNEENRR